MATVVGQGEARAVVTLLLPEQNFTHQCNRTRLAAFTFVGSDPHEREQDPKIQIWRPMNFSQSPPVYMKVGHAIAINGPGDESLEVCADGAFRIASRTYHCILTKDYQVSIQSGDILGLEIPPTNDDDFELFFTSGGPTNYVFNRQLNSSEVDLSTNDSETQQTPQLSFSLTSGSSSFCV